ncbi:Uncharacterised protein [Candidatus Norongarragalina meridionalis]|nr:Uncharacterised protein [Candidatus Norongarragalina meridionalis]
MFGDAGRAISRRRGFVSIALVLLFVFPLLRVASLENDSLRTTAFYRDKALLLERRYYAEMDFKEGARQALESARGDTAEAKAIDAGRKLAALERFLEGKYSKEGISFDAWAGVLTKEEADSMRERMLAEGKALKCALCLDIGASVAAYDDETVPIAAAFIDASVSPKISRNGLYLSPSENALLGSAPGVFAIGASIAAPGIAGIALAPEGFR